MAHKARLLLAAVGLGLLFTGFHIGSASALASSKGTVLTTSPIAIHLSTKPGQTVTTTMQVQNNGTTPVTIALRLEKFKALGESGQAAIYAPNSADPSLYWVHFSQTSIVAQPGVWNSVTVTIDVPIDASLGYYYAVLFEPQVQASTQNGLSNVVKGANAIFVLLDTNSANENRQLSVSSFTSLHGIYEYLPATFTATIDNPGNIYLIPNGDVFISRTPNGKALATLDINPGQGAILPQSPRQFQVQWSDGFPVFVPKRINGQIVSNSKGVPEQVLQWNSNSSFSKIRFGHYYAHLALVYNNGTNSKVTNVYVSFWVIPWKLILLFVFVIALIIFLWKFLKISIRRAWHLTPMHHKKSDAKN
jgi:hypothetical protein